MTDLIRDEMDFVDRIRALADEMDDADRELMTPPPSVWRGIEHGVADEPANVHRLLPRRLPLLAAAAALIAVLALGAVMSTRSGSDSRFIAEAAIVNDGLPVANPDAGVAQLREVDGRLVLDVDVPDLPDADGFYELWIIDTDVAGMQSLGVVTGDGEYALPDGIDPTAFPVVDISVEPTDGDPTHSGQSIWRGVLEI